MKFRMKPNVVACLIAGLLAGSMAQAETRTLSGQFLDVTFDTAQIPLAFGNVSLVETPFEWACSGQSCTMAAPPSVSVVFGSATGSPVSMTQSSLDFRFDTQFKNAVDVIDPLGNTWGIAVADNGKWAFGANIAGQHAPTDAAFATAFGQFKGYVAVFPAPFHFVAPTWPGGIETRTSVPDWPSRNIAYTEDATVLGLRQTGWVGFGPGDQGMPLRDGSIDDLDGFNDAWRLRVNLISAYYALPSTTDPRCQSLSCMSFAEGILDVSSYAFKMAVVATPSAVPEVQTSTMAVVGLGLMGWMLSRRRSNKQA